MKRDVSFKKGRAVTAPSMFAAAMAMAVFGAGTAGAEDSSSSPFLKNRTIGYALTLKHWALYQTPEGKVECPNGFNDGPREQFKLLFPADGTERTLMETQLARESEVWHPNLTPEPYPFHEVAGTVSMGLDLDGRTDANDFTSPDGDEGIDNQLYRTLGCIANFRGPDGTAYHFENSFMHTYNYNRFLIELTDVDSLENDDDVTVTTYRGLDYILTDATGKDYIAGGTQRADLRWGKQFIQTFKGKITDGILTTEAADLDMPWSSTFKTSNVHSFKDVQFKLRLTDEAAEGIIAGYADLEDWYYHATTNWSTHHQSYGQESSPSMWRALNKLADGHPDPETGKNTSISMAIEAKFTQVFILHPQLEVPSQEVASAD